MPNRLLGFVKRSDFKFSGMTKVVKNSSLML